MPESPHVNASRSSDCSIVSPTLFVATVFEDDVAAECARRLMRRILRMAGLAEPVQEYAWGLHLFDQPDGLAVAARRAASADVVVVATHGNSAALGRVADWLTHWLGPQRQKPGALVAIWTEQPDAPTTPAVHEKQLSSIAGQINMKFFFTRVPVLMEFTDDVPPAPRR